MHCKIHGLTIEQLILPSLRNKLQTNNLHLNNSFSAPTFVSSNTAKKAKFTAKFSSTHAKLIWGHERKFLD